MAVGGREGGREEGGVWGWGWEGVVGWEGLGWARWMDGGFRLAGMFRPGRFDLFLHRALAVIVRVPLSKDGRSVAFVGLCRMMCRKGHCAST